jgi:ABC-type antimicrobial peptide transport system permease subunit
MAWLALRAQLRQRWRAMAGLALLLGLAGGVVLTAAAGAERTATAYPRLLTWANAAQVNTVTGVPDPAYLAALARLPQVAAVTPEYQYALELPVPHGAPATLQVWSSPDGSYGRTVDRVKITAGRMFSGGAAGEAVIDPRLASLAHLRPGDTLRLLGIPATEGVTDLSHAFPVSVRITGIGVFDDQVVPVTAANGEPMMLLSPAFTRTKSAASSIYLAQAGVQLRPGASPAAFIAAAKAAERKYPEAQKESPVFINLSDQVAATERAMRPEAVALGIFAALAGLIALAVTGQLLARQLALDSAEFPVLRALGATRGSVLGVALARLVVVTIAGGIVAVTVAIAASPLTPVGAARLAEPDPGVSVNAGVLGAGLAVIALAPLVLLALPAWLAARAALGPLGVAEPASRGRPSRLAAVIALAGPVAAGVGVRMALEPGRGRTAVPVRSALAGTTLAIGALVAAAVFGASLAGLVGTPARYGQNWDAELNLGFSAVPASFAATRVFAAEPAITGYAGGDTGQVSVDGALVPAVGVDALGGGPSGGTRVSGSVAAGGYLTLLAGHAPTGPGQIALGALTMRAVHARLGQDVEVAVNFSTGTAGPQRARTMRVVGEAVFPNFGLSGLSDTDLGSGAIVATSLLTTTQANTGCTGHIACYNFFLLRYRPGTDRAAAASVLLTATAKAGCPAGVCTMTASEQPGDIQDYVAVRDTPLLLGAVLAVLAAGTLAHVLLTGVRRRRRDFAVLKALGLTRGQLRGAVAWEATALATAALVVGVPAGIVAGRLAWAAFATEAGVASGATFDLALVLLTIPATLLLANVIAAWPGRTAARLLPAAVLRAE